MTFLYDIFVQQVQYSYRWQVKIDAIQKGLLCEFMNKVDEVW